MARFILRRTGQAALVLLVMSFVIYSLIGLMPGDPIDIMIASNPGATPEVVAHLRAIYGLDQPILLRYWHWLVAALQGDFGFSRTHAQPVLHVLGPALWVTCKLMLASFVLSVLLAFLLGIAAALRPGGWLDGAVSLFAFAGISVPVFWLALVMILVFAVQLHWLPASGLSHGGRRQLRDQPAPPGHAGGHPGTGQHRAVHPLRPRRHDRDAAHGPRPHRARQGGGGGPHRAGARPAQRHDPRRHRDGAQLRHPVQRRPGHRDDVRRSPAWAR